VAYCPATDEVFLGFTKTFGCVASTGTGESVHPLR
jgi:hypothetical protein